MYFLKDQLQIQEHITSTYPESLANSPSFNLILEKIAITRMSNFFEFLQ